MILFKPYIVDVLTSALDGLYIDSVLLSSYGLRIQFCDIYIHCNERVIAHINGHTHEWNESPNSAPWGDLVRQKFSDVCLPSPNLLRITLQSGDFFEIETLESQYESVTINFPSKDEKIILETF